jgi:polyhydroxyalkanoate synthesis regulator protein
MEKIKKYKNRKLYSTTASKYVTLPYLINKLRNKEPFTVVDSNNADVTSKVLRQALATSGITDETVRKILVGE